MIKTIKQIKFELLKSKPKHLELNQIIRAIKETAIEDFKDVNDSRAIQEYIREKFNLTPEDLI